MADPETPRRPSRARRDQQRDSLAQQWRSLTRAATIVALLTCPAFFLVLYKVNDLRLLESIVIAFFGVMAFRGLLDVVARRFIPSPSLYRASEEIAASDILAKRRLWYWRTRWRRFMWLVLLAGILILFIFAIQYATGSAVSLGNVLNTIGDWAPSIAPLFVILIFQLPVLFFSNLIILFGPMLFFAIQQMRGYEPGDADWGVKLADVRGLAEVKEEINRVIALWQAGEEFEQAGGKRERGLLFLGQPGTGKTMLAKAIATNFNCPFVTFPGSGFQQTFMGLDAIVVRLLARKAKRLARKWGGQCIVFIDEIDAVGMRRSALGGAHMESTPTLSDLAFFGPMGSPHENGELLIETREWRDKLFAARAELERAQQLPPRFSGIVNQVFPGMGGMGMGGMALNQLLIVMDGIDDPPWLRRVLTNRINTFLDAMYVIPQTVGRVSFRLPRPKPASEQVFFIGATNVPLGSLDPALVRPGRLGRHIYFRTPTKQDRMDVFDLYINKVAHVPDLDTPKRREEMARITPGYSPAMIEQICSMALTYAHADDRYEFEWRDLIEAMTTVESGLAVELEYMADENRATAIHEAGHAVASHLYGENLISTRLSIRMRGNSLGHHYAAQKEEKFGEWRREKYARLIHILGAMAAEETFYGETTTGVAGDLRMVTIEAALMAGGYGMAARPVNLAEEVSGEVRTGEARENVHERFEEIGQKLLNRVTGGPGSVLEDKNKYAIVAQLLGEAYFIAYQTMQHNRRGIDYIADVLMERREMHGDEVVDVLDRAGLQAPKISYLTSAWPKI